MAGSIPDSVLNHPAIWRGSECARGTAAGVPTGYAELDAVLPGAGWPPGVLTEIHVERNGIGELKLTLPALARLTRAGRWVAMIAPPHIPYAPALAAQGIGLDHFMLVRAQTIDEQLWACEQALEGCGAVAIWLDRVADRALRRLQHVAERNGAVALMFRPARAIPFTTAALRLHVSKSDSRTVVRVLKRRGGGMPVPVALDLHDVGQRHPVMPPQRQRPAVSVSAVF